MATARECYLYTIHIERECKQRLEKGGWTIISPYTLLCRGPNLEMQNSPFRVPGFLSTQVLVQTGALVCNASPWNLLNKPPPFDLFPGSMLFKSAFPFLSFTFESSHSMAGTILDSLCISTLTLSTPHLPHSIRRLFFLLKTLLFWWPLLCFLQPYIFPIISPKIRLPLWMIAPFVGKKKKILKIPIH